MSIFKITSVFEIAKHGNQVNHFTIREAELELTALREAGEKMAALLGEDITDDQLTEALEAWEAANK